MSDQTNTPYRSISLDSSFTKKNRNVHPIESQSYQVMEQIESLNKIPLQDERNVLTNSLSNLTLLSIDGGGVRGLIVLHCLAKWEQQYGFRTPDLFNCYSGTSIGAIIVCFFAYMNWSAQEVLDYFNEKQLLQKFLPKSLWDRIFGLFQWKPKYNDSQRLEILSDIFGDKTLKETNNQVLITGYDLVREKTVYFTSFGTGKHFNIVDTLLVSSSAPIYFSSVYIDKFYCEKQKIILHADSGHYEPSDKEQSGGGCCGLWGVDGGLTCNNPSDVMVLELLKMIPNDIKVISIGSGFTKETINPSNTQDWGIFRWLFSGRLLQKIANGSADIAQKRCHTILDIYHKTILKHKNIQKYYMRINGEIQKDNWPLDNTCPRNLEALQNYGEIWACNHDAEFCEILKILKNQFQTSAPESRYPISQTTKS